MHDQRTDPCCGADTKSTVVTCRAINVPTKLLDALDFHKLGHGREPLLIQLSTDQVCVLAFCAFVLERLTSSAPNLLIMFSSPALHQHR